MGPTIGGADADAPLADDAVVPLADDADAPLASPLGDLPPLKVAPSAHQPHRQLKALKTPHPPTWAGEQGHDDMLTGLGLFNVPSVDKTLGVTASQQPDLTYPDGTPKSAVMLQVQYLLNRYVGSKEHGGFQEELTATKEGPEPGDAEQMLKTVLKKVKETKKGQKVTSERWRVEERAALRAVAATRLVKMKHEYAQMPNVHWEKEPEDWDDPAAYQDWKAAVGYEAKNVKKEWKPKKKKKRGKKAPDTGAAGEPEEGVPDAMEPESVPSATPGAVSYTHLKLPTPPYV